ncbi:hypothetical protein MKW92_041276 [Papaver armeniacum]|nr:hypothetical protein MKW92_041276 [Papaver armeniacum]
MGVQKDKLRFNVRGKIFKTSATTHASAPRNSMLGAMLDDIWKLQPRELNKGNFIDRNPDCFSVLLDLLGTGELHVPPNIPKKLLYREAHYYGLLDHVRTAKWGQFDSNRLILTGTVSGQAPSSCTAIRASPDGGCVVAHGSIVRVYDLMLQEHPPINLSYQNVSDIGWIDSENIVISVYDRLSQPPGGVGLFSSSTGTLRHKFMLNNENMVQNFTARALCLNSDNKIFASCRGKSDQGIGVRDPVVGKQIDFFGSVNGPDGFPVGDADKIQWLNGSNCLFLWSYKKSCIGLLDFRD